MDKPLVAEMVAAFLSPRVFEQELADNDPLRAQAKKIADHFTFAVGFLREHFPNDNIRKLATLLWDVCGSKTVPLALGPKVPSLHFGLMGGDAVIFAPENWVDLVKKDAVFQMGGVVFVGVQACDYYSGRLTTQAEAEETRRRSKAYEAEYMLTVKKKTPKHKFNDYQRGVMRDYPAGLQSVPELFYEYPKFESAPTA